MNIPLFTGIHSWSNSYIKLNWSTFYGYRDGYSCLNHETWNHLGTQCSVSNYILYYSCSDHCKNSSRLLCKIIIYVFGQTSVSYILYWWFKLVNFSSLQALIPMCGWLMVTPWCVSLSGCQGWQLILSNHKSSRTGGPKHVDLWTDLPKIPKGPHRYSNLQISIPLWGYRLVTQEPIYFLKNMFHF